MKTTSTARSVRWLLGSVLLVMGFASIVHATEGGGTISAYSLFVLNSPAPGLEQEFNRWYDHQHAQDVLVNPGYISSQRFIASRRQLRPGAKPPTQYAIDFEIESLDIAKTLGLIGENIRTGKTVPTNSIAKGPGRGGDFTYQALSETHPGPAPEPGVGSIHPSPAARFLQMAFSAPAPGREMEFNRWYSEVYTPALAKLPQVRQWRRYELSPVQLTSNRLPMAEQYLLLFEFDVQGERSFERLQREVAKVESALPADIGTLGDSFTYEPLGPRLLAEQVRKERGLSPSTASSRSLSAEEASLLEVDLRRFHAMVDRGIPELERTLTDELVYVHSSSTRQSKDELVRDIATGKAVYRRIDVKEQQPRVYGQTGVIEGIASFTTGTESHETTFTLRYTDVYVQRDGRWQMVAWHCTRIPDLN
jgi:hypothetical protein